MNRLQISLTVQISTQPAHSNRRLIGPLISQSESTRTDRVTEWDELLVPELIYLQNVPQNYDYDFMFCYAEYSLS